MRLAISKSSFHYKYHNVLKRMWGMKEENGKMTNLCTYSHFLFWMTIFSVLLSPFLVIGWLILKIGRALYKSLSLTVTGRKFVDLLDKVFGIGGLLETASAHMVDNAVRTLILTTLLLIVFISIPIICFLGFMPLIQFICLVPLALVELSMIVAGFLMVIGVFIVNLSWIITTILIIAGLKVVDLVLFCFSKTLIFLTGIGLWILMGICFLSIGSIITILLIRLALSLEKVNQFITFKINGFHSARKIIKKRRTEEKKNKEKLKKILIKNKKEIKKKKISGEIEYSYAEKIMLAIENFLIKCWKSFVKILNFIKYIFFAKTAQVKGGTFKIMGGFSLLWNLLMSIKDGVCPFVEFIDEEDLEGKEPK